VEQGEANPPGAGCKKGKTGKGTETEKGKPGEGAEFEEGTGGEKRQTSLAEALHKIIGKKIAWVSALISLLPPCISSVCAISHTKGAEELRRPLII
jgi:hypothetical protein